MEKDKRFYHGNVFELLKLIKFFKLQGIMFLLLLIIVIIVYNFVFINLKYLFAFISLVNLSKNDGGLFIKIIIYL